MIVRKGEFICRQFRGFFYIRDTWPAWCSPGIDALWLWFSKHSMTLSLKIDICVISVQNDLFPNEGKKKKNNNKGGKSKQVIVWWYSIYFFYVVCVAQKQLFRLEHLLLLPWESVVWEEQESALLCGSMHEVANVYRWNFVCV